MLFLKRSKLSLGKVELEDFSSVLQSLQRKKTALDCTAPIKEHSQTNPSQPVLNPTLYLGTNGQSVVKQQNQKSAVIKFGRTQEAKSTEESADHSMLQDRFIRACEAKLFFEKAPDARVTLIDPRERIYVPKDARMLEQGVCWEITESFTTQVQGLLLYFPGEKRPVRLEAALEVRVLAGSPARSNKNRAQQKHL